MMSEYIPVPLSDDEIRSTVAQLSEHFKVKARWRRKSAGEERKSVYRDIEGRGAYTNLETKTMVFGAKVDIMVILHEFAHIVDTTFPNWRMETLLGFVSAHGKRFRGSLEKVAQYFLGDAAKYDWSSEYPSIVKWAHSKGYTEHTVTKLWRAINDPIEAERMKMHLDECEVCRGDDDSE